MHQVACGTAATFLSRHRGERHAAEPQAGRAEKLPAGLMLGKFKEGMHGKALKAINHEVHEGHEKRQWNDS
jgi:hypothetical protein